jgi:hypothetical protein
MSTVIKKKIDIASVNDDNKHIIVTLQISTNHAVDHIVLDNLLKQLTSASQTPFYKDYAKPVKEKSKMNKNKFQFGNSV